MLESRVLLSVDSQMPMGPAFGGGTGPITVESGSYDPSHLLIRYRTGVLVPVKVTAPTTSERWITLPDGSEVQVAETAYPLVPGLCSVALPPGADVRTFLSAYRTDPRVEYAEPDYIVRATGTPDDPMFGSQWNLRNVGQTGGTPGADINATRAWGVTTGQASTRIAVIDTGVDYNHPDLAANIWTNPGEIPGNGIDDDGNGYVDDVHGYNFVNHNGNPMDDNGHGTHVAGTIGAIGDNGVGVVGVNWHVQIMPLKFLDASGSGTVSGSIAALNYAVANGASLSNNSWGGGAYSLALHDAIAAAGAQGHIFVAAAGNNGANTDTAPYYPASYDLANIVSVAASDASDQLAGFSNYGPVSVDLAAPGVNILSTLRGGGYGTMSGTSMAVPHVTGVLALVRGQHPQWTSNQVIAQVLSTVDPLASLSGKTVTGGRLNAARAVGGDLTPPTVTIATVAPSPRMTALDSLAITFSEPVQGFDLGDLSLTRDGVAVSLTGATLISGNNTSFTLGNLNAMTAAQGHYVLSLRADGSGITDLAGNPLADDASTAWQVLTNLAVTALIPDADGVSVQFNRAFDPSSLNLYDSALSPLGPADLTLVGAASGPVAGSLVLDSSGRSLRFLKTGGVLVNDTYTVRLRSALNGFRDTSGGLLDGNSDGTAGDDYVATFRVDNPSNAVILSVPDFARGPGQAVTLVAGSSVGIPLRLSDGTGVESLDLTLRYNSALLTIGVATLAAGVPGTLLQTGSTANSVSYHYSTSVPLGSGPRTLLSVQAIVPSTAPYASKEVLDLTGLSLNGGAILVLGDSGLHEVSYVGDTDGSGDYGSHDAALIARVGVFLDSGFAAYRLVDPLIVGDVDGSGDLGSFDASLVARKGVFLPVPQIPDLPPIAPRFDGGPDPKVSLPRGLVATAGATLRVPILLEQTDRSTITLQSADLAIGLDPSRFEVLGVEAGTLGIGSWLSWSYDRAGGTLLISASGLSPLRLSPGEQGTLAELVLRVRDDSAPGWTALNLLSTGEVPAGGKPTRLNEGHLTLIPAPSNAANDPVDGEIRITQSTAENVQTEAGSSEAFGYRQIVGGRAFLNEPIDRMVPIGFGFPQDQPQAIIGLICGGPVGNETIHKKVDNLHRPRKELAVVARRSATPREPE